MRQHQQRRRTLQIPGVPKAFRGRRGHRFSGSGWFLLFGLSVRREVETVLIGMRVKVGLIGERAIGLHRHEQEEPSQPYGAGK